MQLKNFIIEKQVQVIDPFVHFFLHKGKMYDCTHKRVLLKNTTLNLIFMSYIVVLSTD